MTASTKGHDRTGVWIAGARGDIASTLIVGATALKLQQISSTGMSTEIPPISNLDLVKMNDLFIGGMDITDGKLVESARAVGKRSGTFSTELVELIAPSLDAIDQDILHEPHAAWGPATQPQTPLDVASLIVKLRKHLRDFSAKHQLNHTVVVNLSSSERLPNDAPEHDTLEGIDRLIADNRSQHVLYVCSFPGGLFVHQFHPQSRHRSARVAGTGQSGRFTLLRE
jgi:myo-inositol-1-phosphate synthase